MNIHHLTYYSFKVSSYQKDFRNFLSKKTNIVETFTYKLLSHLHLFVFNNYAYFNNFKIINFLNKIPCDIK